MNDIIVREGEKLVVAKEFLDYAKAVTARKKQAEADEKKLKEDLCREMEKYGIERIDNDEEGITIIHFPSTERRIFDQDAFLMEFPDLYEEYKTKTSVTKSYVTIKPKKVST